MKGCRYRDSKEKKASLNVQKVSWTNWNCHGFPGHICRNFGQESWLTKSFLLHSFEIETDRRGSGKNKTGNFLLMKIE